MKEAYSNLPLSPAVFGEDDSNLRETGIPMRQFGWGPQARALGASGGARRSRRHSRKHRKTAHKAKKAGGARRRHTARRHRRHSRKH